MITTTKRNTRIRISPGSVIRILDAIPGATDKECLGEFDAVLTESVEVTVASEMKVEKP
jgi:hypothetical protein